MDTETVFSRKGWTPYKKIGNIEFIARSRMGSWDFDTVEDAEMFAIILLDNINWLFSVTVRKQQMDSEGFPFKVYIVIREYTTKWA